ncbi:MAG: hypothetical protein KDB07_04750, partial [Planctomycetes bacterium]|nr:hypothetical protein [Planctomycetota bacterium]
AHREDWPCHYSALDLKSYYGGTKGLDFLDCSMTDMRDEFRIGANKNAHDAQADADYQLELLFRTFVKAGMIPRAGDDPA